MILDFHDVIHTINFHVIHLNIPMSIIGKGGLDILTPNWAKVKDVHTETNNANQQPMLKEV